MISVINDPVDKVFKKDNPVAQAEAQMLNGGIQANTSLAVAPLEHTAQAYDELKNSSFGQDLLTGLKNWWYNFTGQTEKTSAYQAQLEQEKHKIQTLADDMEAAGLSKYAMSVSGSSLIQLPEIRNQRVFSI